MGEFFHGWRRKAGCVTLVMACVFAGMWMRSLIVWDWISVYPTSDTLLEFKSELGRLGYEWESCEEYEVMPVDWMSGAHTPGVRRFAYLSGGYPEYFVWRCDWGGVSVGVYKSRNMSFFVIPYWAIVLPLTLLSAYLILWKPRKSAAKPVVDDAG